MSRDAKILWVAFGVLAVAFCVLMLSSCGIYTEQSKTAQVEAAKVSQEIACQRHLKAFLDGKDEGLSCEASKRKAAAENPLCNLSFTCKTLDGKGAAR